MISNKFIEDAANAKISAGSLTDLEITQLSAISASLTNATKSVALIADLPDAAANTGRMIYVTGEEKYYFSDGEEWGIDYSTTYSESSIAYAWGLNSAGQLGDGTTTSISSPVSVIGGITNWSQLAAARNHGLGLTSTGIAYAWGDNSGGRLGDGTTTNRSSPVSVIGGLSWSQLSGMNHSLGLTTTGIAYAWGLNSAGQLGDGTTTSISSPVSVIGGITNWTQLSAGGYHSLGVTSAGIAYAWGDNSGGRLGDGTTTNRSSPVSVIGGITNWSQLSASKSGATTGHSLGVTSDGIAYAWGKNNFGQLGDGTTTSISSPVSVIGGITNWSQVSAGSSHNLCLTRDGIAYAWGLNSAGQLGDGTTTSISSPVSVIGGITNWTQLSAGSSHSLGVTSAGIAYAWGSGATGRLGDGTTVGKSSPVSVIGGITNWSQVSAGSSHSLGAVVIGTGFNL